MMTIRNGKAINNIIMGGAGLHLRRRGVSVIEAFFSKSAHVRIVSPAQILTHLSYITKK
jgi:hypothetical protein